MARKWLNRLRYQYQHIRKNVFVDGYKRSDVVEDQKVFLKIMKEIKLYLVEFDHKGKMLSKTYLFDCKVEGEDRQPIIIITHDECTFSSNDDP